MKKVLFFIAAGLLLVSCSKVEVPVSQVPGVFIDRIPFSEDMKIEDFPGYKSGYSDAMAIAEDAVYLVSDPYIMKYDFDGNLLAYADPKILPCGVEVEKVGDKLFVACREEGVYEIDLTKNEIAYNYTHEDGIEEYRNPNFAVQGKNLWMGTFDGVAKIDTETRKISFYDELNFPGSHLSSTVYANGDLVWAIVSANAYNSGSAGYYNADDDTWTIFGVKDFKKTDPDRVDFHRFVASSEGVFASFQDGGPENTVLTKFDDATQKWIQIYAAGWGEFGDKVESYLPARETYSQYEINSDWKNPLAKFRIYKDGTWKDAGDVPSYVALSPLVEDTYYLLSTKGIHSFSKEDAFPKFVTGTEFVRGDVKMFVSDNNKYLVALIADINEMGGELNSYAVQVLNLEDLSYYAREIDGDGVEQEDVFQISEKIEMLQDGDKMYIELTSGKKLTLDLGEKTFGIN